MARRGKAVLLMITTKHQSTDELQNIAIEWAAHLIVILESQTSYLGTKNVIEVFHRYPEFLDTHTESHLTDCHHFLPDICQFIIHCSGRVA